MILAPLLGTALIVAVATDPLTDLTATPRPSAQERAAATEPLVRSATECIVHAVIADPRYAAAGPNARLGDLIVDSMPVCLAPVRATRGNSAKFHTRPSSERSEPRKTTGDG